MPKARFIATEGSKVCKDCHLDLHVTKFRVHQNYTDGRFTRCRACQKEYESNTLAERSIQAAQLAEPRYYWDGYQAHCKRCQSAKLYVELGDIWCLDCGEQITTGNQPVPLVLTKLKLLAKESQSSGQCRAV